MKALEGKVDSESAPSASATNTINTTNTNSTASTASTANAFDYSVRLGVADGLESLEHFERRGVRLSPWVWFGSLVGEMQSATMERYPDLISAGVTVRWCCPECKEVMYVKKEELMSHLNECVK